MKIEQTGKDLVTSLKAVIISSRSRTYKAVNSALLECYWNIGRRSGGITQETSNYNLYSLPGVN